MFASEIKGVLAHPDVPAQLDPAAIPAYLTFGYVPTPRTFFAGIRSLPPGHVLTLEAGGEPQVERYWKPPSPGPTVGSCRGLARRGREPSCAVCSTRSGARGAWSPTFRSARFSAAARLERDRRVDGRV